MISACLSLWNENFYFHIFCCCSMSWCSVKQRKFLAFFLFSSLIWKWKMIHFRNWQYPYKYLYRFSCVFWYASLDGRRSASVCAVFSLENFILKRTFHGWRRYAGRLRINIYAPIQINPNLFLKRILDVLCDWNLLI